MRLLLFLMLWSQDYSHRGFVEGDAVLYPDTVPNDSAGTVAETRVRYEGFYRPHQAWQINGGIDLRLDSHHQTERKWRFDWQDRERQRPVAALRRLSFQYHRGGLTVEAGKQFVRWGRTDIINPTDRFAPRDYLTVVDNEFLGITAARATYGRGPDTIDVLWSPRMTPSRVPLFTQRWYVPPPGVPPSFGVERAIPEGSQAGIRWSHVGLVEFSAAYYSGFNHTPNYEPVPGELAVRETYAPQRMIGGDAAIPLRWLSIKGEAGYFMARGNPYDEYVLYVVQLERQAGEWFFVGGYGGEAVTKKGSRNIDFSPERGLLQTLLFRAGYTIDVNRSISFETAMRENLDGGWMKSEYTQAFGQHWRVTTSLSLIRGEPIDFLGQYRRNSHGTIAVRYSF